MEPVSSSPYPQVPATCPYPEPTPSSPHDPFQLREDPSKYYPPIYVLVSPMASFPQASPPPYFVYGCMIRPLETVPPEDLSGVVVYLRIVLSPEEASQLMGNS